jgi:histidine triad (HIT) family protein
LERKAMTTLKEDSADCFVCRKHRGEIVVPGGAIYEDASVYAGHVQIREENADVYLGHLMVEPERHAPGLADLTGTEAQTLGLLVAHLSRAFKTSEGAEHVYAFVLGDHVAYLHIHLVPRYPGTPRAYWGVRVDEWPNEPRGDSQEMSALCARLRKFLE